MIGEPRRKTVLKFLGGGQVHAVPLEDAYLGVTFICPPDPSGEARAREGLYGRHPRWWTRLCRWALRLGPTLRQRDDTFRKKWGLT